MSFVKGQRQWNWGVRILGRFVISFSLTTLLVFGLANTVGLAFQGLAGGRVALYSNVGGLAAALALDLYALPRTKWCPLSVRRQTPQAVMYVHGMKRAALAWGADAGLLFSTFRVSAISWAVLLAALTGVGSWLGGVAYAGGFLMPLVVACWSGMLTDDARPHVAQAFRRCNRSARRVAAVALIAALILVASTLW